MPTFSLHVSESYSAPNLASPDAENRVNAAVTYGFMADAALVAIDPRTCLPRDCAMPQSTTSGARSIPSSSAARWRAASCTAWRALYEHCDYDDFGQMLNASFMDYLCPTSAETPRILVDHHDVPSPFTELGIKGAARTARCRRRRRSPAPWRTRCEITVSRSGNSR